MSTSARSIRAPHEVDKHVGVRMRVLRRQKRLSQEWLADALGLTFQQVQKYERGSNRVCASRLHAIASALGVSVSYFFEGLEPVGDAASPETGAHDFLMTREGQDLAEAFPRVKSAGLRRQVLDLVRAMAIEDEV